ncbi:MAG: hypothetical protein ABI835_02885 [Chloroflexota bacterium]
MVMVADDPTLPPRYVVENYRRAFTSINGREPFVRYMGNHWYNVNGETVHRSTLMEEIARLRSLSQRQNIKANTDKSVIQRLIARLRSL